MNIELKPWTEELLDEAAHIFTLANRDYLSDRLPMPYTREDAQRWFSACVAPAEGRTGLFRAVFVDGVCAGEVSLECQSDVCRRDAHIGYVLLDAYRGRGAMTEAVRRAVREAFETLDILRVSARVFSPNAASRRVLEKNGFTLEGRIPRAVCKGENIYDLCLYGRLR